MSTITGKDPVSGDTLVVTLNGDRIANIEPGEPGDWPWLSAGWIDLQVNGYLGVDCNAPDLDPQAFESLAQVLLAEGVTTFLPTLVTASEARLIALLRTIRDARQQSSRLRRMVPAVHVEGPFISAEDGPRGAHPVDHVRPPDLAEVERWQKACDGLVGLVTLSPHWADSPEFIEALTQRGIAVALGHTHASETEIEAAVAAGAGLSTHLGNGVAANLPRHPNLLWSQLAHDGLCASFIADGHHLPSATLKAMLRAKGADRRLLVSDATALGGMPPGEYQQPIGGSVELGADGRLSLAGTPYLAGAALPLTVGIAHVVQQAGLTLAETLDMVTRTPGRWVGERGKLGVGEAADLLLFDYAPGDPRITIRQTWLAGEQVYPQ